MERRVGGERGRGGRGGRIGHGGRSGGRCLRWEAQVVEAIGDLFLEEVEVFELLLVVAVHGHDLVAADADSVRFRNEPWMSVAGLIDPWFFRERKCFCRARGWGGGSSNG
ncbi:hypothetical protein Vadar_028898 [Vaccinium darrowii]|uniref:Uncharacterized protein n=1 Tax=Vaccinium darrowii TaxID=229202 RepID=A0ACB7YH74_9ERIC|nr:hypothetical protein Vadar_028898 [Vaccinium darrowii]